MVENEKIIEDTVEGQSFSVILTLKRQQRQNRADFMLVTDLPVGHSDVMTPTSW